MGNTVLEAAAYALDVLNSGRTILLRDVTAVRPSISDLRTLPSIGEAAENVQVTAPSKKELGIFPLPKPRRILQELKRTPQAALYLLEALDKPRKVSFGKHYFHDPNSVQRLLNQASLLKSSSSIPSILDVFQYTTVSKEDEVEFLFEVEYLPPGEAPDLDAYLREKNNLSEEDTLRLILGTSQALIEGLRRGLLHLDIKPENIFWHREHRFPIVGDWDIAADFEHLSVPSQGFQGTLEYAPVEMLVKESHLDEDPLRYVATLERVRQQGFTRTSDVHSLFATAYRAFTGRKPFGISRERYAPIEVAIQERLNADIKAGAFQKNSPAYKTSYAYLRTCMLVREFADLVTHKPDFSPFPSQLKGLLSDMYGEGFPKSRLPLEEVVARTQGILGVKDLYMGKR